MEIQKLLVLLNKLVENEIGEEDLWEWEDPLMGGSLCAHHKVSPYRVGFR